MLTCLEMGFLNMIFIDICKNGSNDMLLPFLMKIDMNVC